MNWKNLIEFCCPEDNEDLDELEEGSYVINLCCPEDKYKYYEGIYTYSSTLEEFSFINLTNEIKIIPIEYLECCTGIVTRTVYFLGSVIKLNSNERIFLQPFDIFEISTNEYVLK